MEIATRIAGKVYTDFLDEVLVKHVICDREQIPLGEATCKKVEGGAYTDPRAVRLMTISGKGGYSDDPLKRVVYEKFTNITLLDHLLSVTRGALVLAALDRLNQNPNMDKALLTRRLTVIPVIAFLHDLDKDLMLPRNAPLEANDVEERINRYGIRAFWDSAEVSLSASQIRYLIQKVEASHSHRDPPESPVPRELESFPRYVRLADQLDSAWLSSDPQTGGLQGVLKCLREDQGCLRDDLLRSWHEVRLFDPHHPFLLDELQRWLSVFSFRLTGCLPLIEVHQDGELFMLLPENCFDEVVRLALDKLCGSLPFKLELNVSVRGVPSLYKTYARGIGRICFKA